MSNDQKEAKLKDSAKLKASTADFVGPILKRLELAKNSETEKVIDQIRTDIVNAKDIIDDIGNWGTELIGYFGEIERQIDYWVDHNEMAEWYETVRANLINVHNRLSQNLIVNPPKAGTQPHEKATDLSHKATITEVGESSNRRYQEHQCSMDKKIPMTYMRSFLDSLAIFPENTELKKRFLIYWWTGLRLLTSRQCKGYTSIEEYCECVFSELMHMGILIPVHIREHNQVVDSYTIDPAIHKLLTSARERDYELISQKRKEGTWHLYGSQQWKSGLLNLDQRYLNSKDIMGISNKNHLSAVQLGSWTKTKVHNGVKEEHIEVDQTDFLKQLGQTVTYISLRGISRIEELHESIGSLENLIILDLRSCHNLENLSQKPRSTLKQKLIGRVLPRENMFKNLMVLDISECYLLDIMPKWISELYNLEVLKGFVVGSMGNRSCQLSDLSNLTHLRKLSIRIGSKHLASEDLSGLKPLSKLLVLTIIWGENKSNYAMPILSFPKNLEKLDIRCYPEAKASKLLNATKLKNLKRLYIRGGKLAEIPHSDNWEVEILRLKFLKNLETDWDELKPSFKNLQYLEYVKCPRLKNFPKGKCCWIKKKDEHNQSNKDSETANTHPWIEEKDEHFQFVGPLLKRHELAKEQVPENSETEKIIDQISTDIVNTKDIIDGRENLDRDLIGYFGEIERQIDYCVDHNKMTEWNETIRANLTNVHDRLSQNLIVNPLKASSKPREKASELPQKATITEVGESSNRSYQEHECSMDQKIHVTYLRDFLNSLVIFPKNTELKKRFLIYWWTGLRLLTSRQCKGYTSIEEYCEYVFSELVHEGILIPVHIREHNQVVDSYTIKPAIHKLLISAWERDYVFISQKREEGKWHLYGSQQWKSGLLNLDQRYLNSKEIMDISSHNHLSAVQFGSWRYTKKEVHNGVEEEHIEVDETDFLKQLGETVTYLSLRGILRIEELHESIGKLENLIILDLRSCHNLENLSQKPRSTMKAKLIERVLPRGNMFKNLMVLDISECYQLDIMPKWISELYNLEVLKGFVVGGVGNRSCQLSDLSNLTRLRKLSIRIGSKHSDSEGLSGLEPLKKLLVLTIIWEEKMSNYAMPTLSFPVNLEKLDIRCYPEAEASKLLNAAKLKNLKRLYIRRGKLAEIPRSDNWEVEILRLKFLENLETDWNELKLSFQNLQYVEYVECPKLKNFPKDKCCWIKKKDGHFQSDNETVNQS